MVECEFEMLKRGYKLARVLIDTWWNVNAMKNNEDHIVETVLIDTWWNVNKGRRIAITNARGF